MDDDYLIDDMVEEDLDAVARIEASSFPIPWSRDLFARELGHDHSNNLVARWRRQEGSRVVGYIVFWEVADEIHILDLAVHDDFRRRGIARKLLDSTFDVAKRKGCVRMFLDVRESNRAAMKLYQYYDFKEIAVRERYYQDGEDAIVMSCNLLKKFYGIENEVF